MACLRLRLLACCGLSARAIHVVPGNGEPSDFSAEQRLDALAEIQADALSWLAPDAGETTIRVGHRQPVTFWGCDKLPFRMAMPPHTATCTVTEALALTLKDAGRIDQSCQKHAGQDHDHRGFATTIIERVGWKKFNSSVSFVMGKDPWSRVVSAASWMHGFNASDEPQKQIRDFRSYVYSKLPAKTTPSGIHSFNYLHSISDYAYATPPGKSEEGQVLTYVGRVKELSKSVKHACELLGLQEHCVDPNDPRVTQHWVTGGKRVRTVDLFNDELRGRVAEIWEKDIERFGFEFGEL